MPEDGVTPQSGMSSPYASPVMPYQQSNLQETEQPTHVVGSQGRRGILPSAPGRPAAPMGPGSAKSTVIPQKDTDGKFPCPHCTKTYLHAKHLKRHLLRHTGDRPYMCVLCRNTFSRSDVLKRHCQKCSIRRGNHTGAGHLSHPSAHVKEHHSAQAKAAAEGRLNRRSGTDNQHEERAESTLEFQRDDNRDRRSMTGDGSVFGGGDVLSFMSSNMNPKLANYSILQGLICPTDDC